MLGNLVWARVLAERRLSEEVLRSLSEPRSWAAGEARWGGCVGVLGGSQAAVCEQWG